MEYRKKKDRNSNYLFECVFHCRWREARADTAHPHYEAALDIASVRDENLSQKVRGRDTEGQRYEDGPGR